MCCRCSNHQIFSSYTRPVNCFSFPHGPVSVIVKYILARVDNPRQPNHSVLTKVATMLLLPIYIVLAISPLSAYSAGTSFVLVGDSTTANGSVSILALKCCSLTSALGQHPTLADGATDSALRWLKAPLASTQPTTAQQLAASSLTASGIFRFHSSGAR